MLPIINHRYPVGISSPSPHRNLAFAAGLSVIALLAVPAAGQAADYTIGTHGGWTTTLLEDPGSAPKCVMHSDMQDGGMFAVIGGSNGVSIAAFDPEWAEDPGTSIDVEADLNGSSYTGTATADSREMIEIPVGTSFIQDFIAGDEAVVHLGDNVTWTLDLSGTQDAGSDMSRCLNMIDSVES